MDPERVHELVGGALARSWTHPFLSAYRFCQAAVPIHLQTQICGLPLKHPIGLAAGFDKHARMFQGLKYLGFSHIEVGTVTGKAQAGNPKPRLFRLPKDQALINRMGFNNDGAETAALRLSKSTCSIPIGGNIGKTKTVPIEEAETDYVASFTALHPHVDYFVVNVSSPNTPNLRQLQDKEPLTRLLQSLQHLNQPHKPLLLKVAPDLSNHQLEDIARVVVDTQTDGVIATNTTIQRSGLVSSSQQVSEIGAGGLSGAPVRDRATDVIRFLRQNLPSQVGIVGVGGIFTGEHVYEKICAGADVVQIYTGFIYRGPGAVFNMLTELDNCLRRDGFGQLRDAIASRI